VITIFRFLAGLVLSAAFAAHGAEFSFIVNDSPMEMGHLTKWVQFEDQVEMCLLDTGARKTVVKTLFADRDALGQEPSGGIGGIGDMADLIKMDKIVLDDWVNENLVIRRTQTIPTNCIIGNDIFMKRNFMIDNQRNVFTTDFRPISQPFPLLILNEKWFGFPVKIGERHVHSLFDTGAGATLVDPLLIAEIPENFEFLQNIEITDGASRKLESALYRMKRIDIENQVYQDVVVLAYPLDALQQELPSVRVILGYNIIRKQNWWFNFDLKQWGH